MKAADVCKRAKEIAEKISPKAAVHISVDSRRSKNEMVFCSLYPRGMVGRGEPLVSRSDNWGDALKKVEELWHETAERYNAERLQAMALKIIELTSCHGTCTDRDLRMAGFDQTDIEHYGEAACDKANEMADLGPFTITALSGANAA